MADIFLSYSRADRPRAERVAKALEAENFTVWWDKILRAGETYDEVTERMLRDAAVVVVLWSETSVKSKWVRAEATLGQRSSTLIPAMIDDAERPIMFELTQSADLITWEGDREDPRWKAFISDIQLALETHEAPEVEPPASEPGGPHSATMENTFWDSIKDGSDPADFEAYLKRYPEGHFSDLARNRLNAMAARAPAPVAPEPAKPTPQAEPQPVAAAPAPAQAPPAKKKSGSRGILFLVLALVVGGAAGAYFLSPDLRNTITSTAEDLQSQIMTQAEFQDCDDCPVMVRLAEGQFNMGSVDDEEGRSGNEGPQHEVSVPAFAIAKHEVTFAQWDACVADGGCNGYEPSDRGFGRDGLAVLGVSWQDAQAYASWLSQKTGRAYRLPTEAEWEYAARAGTDTRFWWGNGFDRSRVPGNRPRPVAELPENPFGLTGMLGNAREWVEDCYINNYNTAPTDGSAQLSGDCSLRVLRGGSWRDDAVVHRASNRARVRVAIRDQSYGFRLATSDTEDK